jgi:hypothetical protein
LRSSLEPEYRREKDKRKSAHFRNSLGIAITIRKAREELIRRKYMQLLAGEIVAS